MIKLGGYFMSLPKARLFALHLGIDVGEDSDYAKMHLEWSINDNDWLHDTNNLHVTSAVIRWPRQTGEYGVVFISKFAQVDRESDHIIEEDEKSLEDKKWLEGLGAENLQWVTLIDTRSITLDGFQPQKSGLKFKVAPPGFLESRLNARIASRAVSPPL
ncbi:hypothetical protein K439DRAFT_1630694 [Ramaria rubella]|nr:hypothetical protein K439DRAFT_1630694 [Ramaria rubella]